VFQNKNEVCVLHSWFIYSTIIFTYYRYLTIVGKWGFKKWVLVEVMGFKEWMLVEVMGLKEWMLVEVMGFEE
jgi:hypothetical protein